MPREVDDNTISPFEHSGRLRLTLEGQTMKLALLHNIGDTYLSRIMTVVYS